MQMGAKNPNYRGGKHKNVAGYFFILYPSHPYASSNGYVREHRLVMEQWLCNNEPNHSALVEIAGIKYLKRQWVVHHKNGKRDDNTIENLQLMHKKEHDSFENRGSKNNFYNKCHTDETKKKLSQITKKRWGDQKYREKVIASHKKRWKNDLEYRKKTLKNLRLIHHDPHTEETKRKMSLSKKGEKNPMYGKHPSEDTRKKKSLAIKQYWTEKRKTL